MKKIVDFTIIGKSDYGKAVWLSMQCDEDLPETRPGQFAQIIAAEKPGSYLRRPISVHNIDYQANTIDMLIQRVGKGTINLADMNIGEKINMILPLGNGFTMPDKDNAKTLLVGGGIGTAPLLLLGKTLTEKKHKVTFLLGGRNINDILRLPEYEKIADTAITTEDGSHGTKGFVTQHPIWNNTSFDNIYVCGPKPMMLAVAQRAKDKNTWCEVSLENKMACGIGACLCCVENTNEGNICVCKEGPVFNINRLLW